MFRASARWQDGDMTRVSRRGLRILLRLFRDERGGEMLEYGLIAGLIVVAAISAITCVGQKVLSRWTSIETNM
jgi:pilus assembly protein Flp/PilA